MEKYELLSGIADKLKALDNKLKLRILALLVEEGAKSITDISKELNINFSTAHKYLEQLEKAKLVTSKQVAHNRLKRLFYVNDFSVDLSPGGIASILGKETKKPNKKSTFKLFNNFGQIADFDEKLFARKYLRRGLPRALITSGLTAIKDQAFDGISIAGLHSIFRRHLLTRVSNITNSLREIDKAESRKRTYGNILMLTHPEAIQQHKDGDIFIQNLGEPKLLNFVHDLRGMCIHGIDGERPTTLKELFKQVLEAVNRVSVFTYPYQAFASFNLFIAPLASKLTPSALNTELKKFLLELNKSKIKFYLNLDVGLPEFAKKVPITFFETKKVYENYEKISDKIREEVVSRIKNEKLENIIPVFKVWGDKKLPEFKNLPKYYVANMSHKWQTENSSFCGAVRFSSAWKGWAKSYRVGEAQNITINLPRLALNSKGEKEFFVKLEETIRDCLEYIMNMVELTMGEFLRKHKTIYKSAEKEKWNYVPIDDCSYSISVSGLNETIRYLSKKGLKNNPQLAKKILESCNKTIRKYRTAPVRIRLKEECSLLIAKRFYALDAEVSKLNVPSYSPGISSEKYNLALQKFLSGGHCYRLYHKDAKKTISNPNFSLIEIRK